MTFDAAAIKALYAALESHAQQVGVFERVNTHAPANAPGNGVSCSIELASWAPYAQGSGLNATTSRFTFTVQVFSSLLQKPLEGVDPQVLTALATLVAAYSGAFTLGGLVRDVDLFGMQAQAGYIPDFEGKSFRVISLTVPIVINDTWVQGA